jgi:hypothetical protein
MPPPVFQLNQNVVTNVSVPVRTCLKRGYRKAELPPGKYKDRGSPPG